MRRQGGSLARQQHRPTVSGPLQLGDWPDRGPTRTTASVGLRGKAGSKLAKITGVIDVPNSAKDGVANRKAEATKRWIAG